MATKESKFVLGGDTSAAEAAIASLQRKGEQAAGILEREFNQLGIKTATSFEAQRESATRAYERIKTSGLATADELKRAQKAHADAIVRIDEEQFGKRISLLESYKKNWLLATAVITAASVTAVKAWDLAEQGAKFQAAGTSYANLAAASGVSADKMVADLRRVTNETISVQQLVEKSGTAMLLGVEAKAIPKLAEIAKASSKITGQSVTEAFGDLSLAVARQSKMILDNLGIMVDVEKANKDYAASLGKTSEQLSDTERKQAFLNAVMSEGQSIVEKLGKSVETDADRFAQFDAAIDDIGQSIGILLSGPMADLAAEMKSTVGWLEAYKSGQIGFWEWATTGADEAGEKLKSLSKTNLDAMVTPEGQALAARKLAEAQKKAQAEAAASQKSAAEKAAADREKRLAEIVKHNSKLVDVEKKRIAEIQSLETAHLNKLTSDYENAVKRYESIIDTRSSIRAQLAARNATDSAKSASPQDALNTYLDQQQKIKRTEEQIASSFGMKAEEKAKAYADLIDTAASYNQAVMDGSAELVSAYQTEADYQANKERLQQKIIELLDSEEKSRAEAAVTFGTQMIDAQMFVDGFKDRVQQLDELLNRMNNKEINIIFKAQNVEQLVQAGGGISGLQGTAVNAPIMGGAQHTGTSYVPKTGLYPLARGETVLSRNETQRATQQSVAPVTIAPVFQISGVSASGAEKTGRELAREIWPELQKLAKRSA